MSKDPDDLYSEAISRLGQAYRAHVKDKADDIFRRIKDGEIKDREDLDTAIHEDVDGDGWVIYTAKAQAILLVSDHDGYGVEEGLVSPESFKDGIPWSALAFCAMREDLCECLRRYQDEHGVDIDEDDLGIEEPEDEDEEPESDPSP